MSALELSKDFRNLGITQEAKLISAKLLVDKPAQFVRIRQPAYAADVYVPALLVLSG